MPSFAPTDEQTAIIAAGQTGETVEVQAGAGSGKTSTLVMAAEALSGKAIAYFAFNKDIAAEATSKMPANVEARTVNSFAYRGTIVFPTSPAGKNFIHGGSSMADVHAFLKISAPLDIEMTKPNGEQTTKSFKPRSLGWIAYQTVTKFCQSADAAIAANHVPFQEGLTYEAQATLAATVVPHAQRIWTEIDNDNSHVLAMDHTHYTKRFQLAKLPIKVKVNGEKARKADVILFDEAQDASPVFRAIVENQAGHAQIIVVGDENQAIYGFTGAVNALGNFNASHTLKLTKSFRFGQAIADTANKLLAQLDTDMRIVGHDPVPSTVEMG